MITQEKQAVIVGELHSLQQERVAVVQFPDGSITLFGLPEHVTYEKFSEQVNARPAAYEDLAVFNSTLVEAMIGSGDPFIDLTQAELTTLYSFTVNAAQSLEANRYDHHL